MPVFLLSDKVYFPSPHFARKDGLLAIGGDLSQERLISAYQKGIFPWYSNEEPILWWSPDPRLVLYPDELIVSKSLKKTIRKNHFQITIDKAFFRVIKACAEIRLKKRQPTWIVPEMIHAYCRLHKSGFAHSVEAWHHGKLAGGLYGLAFGKCFSGESMFTQVTDASKTAFVYLVSFLKMMDFQIIDCQVKTSHLMNFGAREISRKIFLQQLEKAMDVSQPSGKWILNANLIREQILKQSS
jgi:leucyl/phenylalanyl-tRNA---protein transferase